jgi:hypothetical protein
MAYLEYDTLFQMGKNKTGNSPKNLVDKLFKMYIITSVYPLSITFIFYRDNLNSCDN